MTHIFDRFIDKATNKQNEKKFKHFSKTYTPHVLTKIMQNEKRDKSKRTIAYVEEVYRQIQAKPDVTDILILNMKGNPIKTTMNKLDAVQYAGLYETLRDKVTMGLQKIDPKNEITMLRVRTIKNETLIVPDGKITVVVIQKPQDNYHKA